MKKFMILVVCSFFTHTTLLSATCDKCALVPIDKQSHFLAGAAIAGFTYTTVYVKTHNHKKAMFYSILSSLTAGALKEVIDSKQPNDKFDTNDFLATGVGGISVGVTLNLFRPKNRSNQNIQADVHRY